MGKASPGPASPSGMQASHAARMQYCRLAWEHCHCFGTMGGDLPINLEILCGVEEAQVGVRWLSVLGGMQH